MWDKSLNVMRKTTERRMEEIGKKNIHFQSGKWPPVWDANLRGPREDPRWEAPWVEEGGEMVSVCMSCGTKQPGDERTVDSITSSLNQTKVG